MIYCALDIGNVLVHADFSDFLDLLCKLVNITLDEANYFMSRTQKLHDLGITKIADELRDRFSIKSEILIDKLICSWNNVIKPDRLLLRRLNDMIATKDLKVALLSNIGIDHAIITGQALNVDGFFDNSIKHFSCHVGARKPTAIYYQSFLQLHPEWKRSVYIDDLQENLDASKQFGFKTFRFSLEEAYKSNHIFKMNELEKFILGEQ